MLPTLTIKINAMVALSTFLYVTDLAADVEGSSKHVITRFVTSFSTSNKNPYPLTAYMENHQYNGDASDQRRRYTRIVLDWRLEKTSSYEAYGKVTEAIIDARFGELDCDTYKKDPMKLLLDRR